MRDRMTSPKAPDLLAVSSRLFNDVGMLISSTKLLSSRMAGKENPIARALRESFLIHLCFVIDFLYPRSSKNGDITAGSFLDPPELWSEIRDRYIDGNSRKVLTDARGRAARELAYLTHGRLSATKLNAVSMRKKWDYAGIETEIRKVLGVFLDHAPAEKLGPKWVPFRSQDRGRPLVFVPAGR